MLTTLLGSTFTTTYYFHPRPLHFNYTLNLPNTHLNKTKTGQWVNLLLALILPQLFHFVSISFEGRAITLLSVSLSTSYHTKKSSTLNVFCMSSMLLAAQWLYLGLFASKPNHLLWLCKCAFDKTTTVSVFCSHTSGILQSKYQIVTTATRRM